MLNRFIVIIVLCLISFPVFSQGILEKQQRKLILPKSYVCYRVSEKLKIDGKLNEKSWQMAEETSSFVDIRGVDFPAPCYDTKVKMLWDEKYLYIGARLQENNIKAILTQRDTIVYHDNDFEVFLDPDGDGMNYFEIETNARGVIFDLMLDKAYRSHGNFMVQWDCPGLKLEIYRDGTLNKFQDTDRCWCVEMAIPYEALTVNFNNPLKAGKYWRINFSRVQWLKPGDHEENWVWTPTGKIDMHMPDRWGFLYFSDQNVEDGHDTFQYPYNMTVYRLLWAMFYEQFDFKAREGLYMRDASQFHMTAKDREGLPDKSSIHVEATTHTFEISITIPENGEEYKVNQDGRFSCERISCRQVKNWLWARIKKDRGEEEYRTWFALLKECGISGVMFEGYDENIYRWCHESGLEAHYWHWTMNRKEVMETHPEWFAVNRKGESSYDAPAYVDYYRFLCPNHEGVADYLADSYIKDANLPYVDGVHLDYVRFPDVVLPVSLWKNYGIEQIQELPEYDYCYCDVCRNKFKEMTGKDPLDLQYPMQCQSWINFRLDGITKIVETITAAVKADGNHKISAAVFPGPGMARSMVRQDWGNWPLDAYFPMIYNDFYYEGIDWIGRSVKESVQAVGGRAKIYAGLMFPHIKDNFEKALDAAFDNGASGVSFFDGPDEEFLRRFKAYLEQRNFQIAN